MEGKYAATEWRKVHVARPSRAASGGQGRGRPAGRTASEGEEPEMEAAATDAAAAADAVKEAEDAAEGEATGEGEAGEGSTEEVEGVSVFSCDLRRRLPLSCPAAAAESPPPPPRSFLRAVEYSLCRMAANKSSSSEQTRQELRGASPGGEEEEEGTAEEDAEEEDAASASGMAQWCGTAELTEEETERREGAVRASASSEGGGQLLRYLVVVSSHGCAAAVGGGAELLEGGTCNGLGWRLQPRLSWSVFCPLAPRWCHEGWGCAHAAEGSRFAERQPQTKGEDRAGTGRG